MPPAHSGLGSLREVLADPKRGRWAVLLLLTLLSWLAMVLRWSLDFDGVLDTDVLNFGLAAFRFDVLDHQPHPPGYPGYVVLLKIVHTLAPWLDPIAVAKWTTRLCGMGITFAAYWACSEVLGGQVAARGRALVAAGISVVHPILWYYGGDGQSHGAEALLTLLLVATCVRVKRSPSRLRVLLVVAIFAIAGSVRPTIPLLSSPLLLWLFWRRPKLDWVLAAVTGIGIVVAWYALLISMSGGLDLYRRASKALVSDMFIASYSVFGDRANFRGVSANLGATAWAALFSAIPLLAIGSLRETWQKPWFRVSVAIAGANVVFFTLMFTAEFGYLIQIAALSVLIPATWPLDTDSTSETSNKLVARDGTIALRFGLTLLVCPVILFLGPSSVPVPYSANAHAPTYPRVVNQAGEQQAYRTLMCGIADHESTLLISDNYSTTNSRWLTMVCPEVSAALFLHDFPLNPKMDNWMFFFSDHMDTVPPEVPLEPGPPSRYMVPPVKRVAVALDSTDELRAAMTENASCSPHWFAPIGPDSAMPVWPARCFDELRFGAHTIVIRSAGEPSFGPEFKGTR